MTRAARIQPTAPRAPLAAHLFVLDLPYRIEIMSKSSEAETRDREVAALYHAAFAAYGAQALWNLREADDPTTEQALLVAHQLRVNGDMKARRLAEQIEQAARADL
jgi:hypothetical protein